MSIESIFILSQESEIPKYVTMVKVNWVNRLVKNKVNFCLKSQF